MESKIDFPAIRKEDGNMNRDTDTTAERRVFIPMSDDDCIELLRIAACSGMTPGALLGAFVGDLVGGTRSNGSDEREKAREWLERCGFEWMNENTFTAYLAERYEIRDAALCLEELEQLQEDMREEGPETAAQTAKLIEACKEELETCYQKYTERVKDPETKEEALNALREYKKEHCNLMYSYDEKEKAL